MVLAPGCAHVEGLRGGARALRADLVRGVDRTRVRRLLCGDPTCGRRIAEIRSYEELAANDALPPWLFDEAVQLSHRSSLLRKEPEHYGPLFPPDTPRDLDYVWPVRSPAVIERELRKGENARRRAQRTAEKLVQDMERVRKKRSAAAKRGWKTRLDKAKREGER